MALFIVVLLNINSYAAVGANDGSAFVTKAEFDALVNTFNDQMDSYQTGLNTKIDGAIANYLSGLSGLSIMDVQPMLTPKNGIWAATTDTNSGPKPWVEGTMTFKFDQYSSRWNPNAAGGGSIITTGQQTSGAKFTEHILKKVVTVSSTKYGEYLGYCKSDVDAVVYGGSIGTGDMSVMLNTNSAYVNCFKWYTGDIPKGHFWICRDRGETGSGDYWWNCNIDNGAVTRTIDDELLNDVICTPTSIDFPYFNLNDTAKSNALWCKDANVESNGLHALISNVGNMASFSGKIRKTDNTEVTKPVANGSYNNGWSVDITASNKRVSGNQLVRTKPFLGFTADVKDWNKVYTKAYDSYISDFEAKSAGVETITENSTKHYLITNGLPMLYAEKDDLVTIPIKFDKIGSAYKNIDIWLKASAFKASEDVKTSQEADIIKPNVNDCTNMQVSVYSNALTLDANAGTSESTKGQGIIKFKMPKSGYVFMKWAVAGNEGKGGGTYYPQKMTIQREN